jgi:hypothetical protein
MLKEPHCSGLARSPEKENEGKLWPHPKKEPGHKGSRLFGLQF